MLRSIAVTAVALLLLWLPAGLQAQTLPGYRPDHDAARAQFRSYVLGEFQEVLGEWLDAVQSREPERAARLYAEDAFLQLDEPARGTAQVEAELVRWVRAVDGIQAGLADFDASGSLAYGTVRVIIDGSPADRQGIMLLVLRRAGGDWKIRAHTLSVD
jgi:ketosteroid isomerase-like protein